MVKKKRIPSHRLLETSAGKDACPSPVAHLAKEHTGGLPPASELQDRATVFALAMMLFLVPAIGVPFQEMLQDTLKSMVAAFLTLIAALLFFRYLHKRQQPLRWHAIMWFPLALMVYALGSMAWSHTYLAGVEAVRWFIFSVLLWLGLNTFSKAALPLLARAIHWGAVTASVWTALQFWFDFSYFPQGPNPASTFVNRNFFAEMVVCAVPFSAWLLAHERRLSRIVWMAFSAAFLMVAVMMTGTRSALVTLWFTLFAVLPLIGYLYRRQFAFVQWDLQRRLLALGVLLVSVVGLGLISSGNPQILGEQRGTNAIERGLYRSASVVSELSDQQEFATSSMSVRLRMWKATWRMITARPFSGVGAGAWEVDAPLYQNADSPLETDYYAHNEFLQLLAEYGLVGWVILSGLLGYLLLSAWLTFRDRKLDPDEGATRAMLLTSLLALLMVSNAGFPWRLASTCIIFSAVLGMLAASDTRRKAPGWSWSSQMPWRPVLSRAAVYASIFFLVLTAYISERAVASEYRIITAVKRALMISQSGDPTSPRWNKTKNELLALMDEGTRINPHYRKITPMVADHLARWGDWENATWIWESVMESRPHILAILSNIVRGYSQMGNYEKALELVERAKKIQPDAPSVRTMELLVLARAGREPQAAKLARQYIEQGIYDFDLVNTAISLGLRTADYDLSLTGLALRNKSWPENQVEALLEMGRIYAEHKNDDVLALDAYRAALESSPGPSRDTTRQQIPAAYRSRL